MTGLAETGDRLGPAEHLLNALAHPPTDRSRSVISLTAVRSAGCGA
jgi:class 3 adenylate cyclase